ncbi:radical SAM protein [Patescibacteria group bacterium]|nr:radical SAM protein [Patescibacteria group bacterium]
MKIKEIKAKSIITKSGLPDSDFVINPYVGCMHGCIYCYARFMKRFTNHKEPWGKFLDIKINASDLIPEKTEKYKNKSITIASVTDAYQPMERKYKLMRGILTNLIPLQPDLCIMTKSDLIVRDIDLLKNFKKCMAGVSLALLDEHIRKEVEPFASPIDKRINAVKELQKAGIRTFIFVSPMLPEFTDWEGIINKTKDFVNEFWFENLNIRATNWPHIKRWLETKHPDLLEKYERIYFTKSDYWNKIEQEIKSFCISKKLNFSVYFHHQKSYS